MPTITPAIKTTEKVKCSSCGEVCQVQVERWTNSVEIQELRLPNQGCSRCGHPWNDLPGPYSTLLRDAYWAPQNYWSTKGRVESQNLARGIRPNGQADLMAFLDDLHAALMLRYARALDTTSGAALRAISASANDAKFRTLDEHLKIWIAELLAMQGELISELQQAWHCYSILAPDRDWVPKATDTIWKPLENASVRWIIEALGISADATMWIASSWLYEPSLQILRTGCVNEWDATQNLLKCLCDRILRKLSLEREQALNDARRALRLSFPPKRRLDQNRNNKRMTLKTPIDQVRELRIISEVLPLNLKGIAYCRAVDSRQIFTRFDWQAKGCPPKYVDAYKREKWKKPIQDEKSRLTRHKLVNSSLTSATSKN